MNKSIIAVAVSLAVVTTGCTSMNQQTGKSETSTMQSAGLGAAIGAVAGGLIAGKKGALIGAAVGGAGGYLVALQMRQKELEEAQQVATAIRQDNTAMHPVVYTKQYVDPQSGKSATGLEKLEIAAPVSETVRKGALNPKAAGAYSKLNGMASQKDGNLVIAVPSSLPKSAIDDIQAAAPNARIVTGSDRSKIVATLSPKSDQSLQSMA